MIIAMINQWFLSIIGIALLTLGIYAVTAEVWIGKAIFEGMAKNILGFLSCSVGIFLIIFNLNEVKRFRK